MDSGTWRLTNGSRFGLAESSTLQKSRSETLDRYSIVFSPSRNETVGSNPSPTSPSKYPRRSRRCRPAVDPCRSLRVGVGNGAYRLGELGDARLFPRPMLYASPVCSVVAASRLALDDVVDVDEISRLRAVAVDGNRFSSERLVPEDADDATVVAPALTWAVYVEVAEGDCFRVVEVVVDPRISVDGPLVDTVGRGRGFGVRSEMGIVSGSP